MLFENGKNERLLFTISAISLIAQERGRRKIQISPFSISFLPEFRRIYYVNDTTLPNLGP